MLGEAARMDFTGLKKQSEDLQTEKDIQVGLEFSGWIGSFLASERP